ncbi:hypothetical protein [Limoniibacter endophyticus]|uniref:DUF1344 domain-containing protein n=1 Tax=Limoniibacter endophyticus TaxID=1565040 RepID=A0A8J3DIR3_9HYPH|nr:hypothetical protein [Limoniibacter endophyticus]GHC71201.1 hypothetical protein GCM10010136_18200 [Limoniibacter endophyticus]
MRKVVLSAIALSFLGLGAASAASHTSAGVVENLNAKAGVVRLANGDQYILPAGTDLSGIGGGDRVIINWETQNSSSIASQQSNNELPARILQADSISLAR